EQRDHVVGACTAYLSGDSDTPLEHCLSKVIETFGWRWGFVLFSYSWLVFLWIVQGTLIRLCCGKLKRVERARATATVLGKVWSCFLFVNVVLAPEDVREWLFWMLWFSSTGLLKMLETVGKGHFEHVVENPRFGVGHTLRTLALHAVVLYLGAHLARVGWNEFFEWGGGPIGQILLSPSQAAVDGDVIDLNGNDGGDGYGYFGAAVSTDPERGGTGFALLLLYDLAVTATEVGLSALKYMTNLLELHKDPDSAYTEEGSLEQTVFFTRLGQAILGASRIVYMFKSCGHCTFVRKVCIRIMSTINGGQTFNRIHGAACRIVLAREMDVAFPDATEQELKTMAADESCAICLKTMTSAKSATAWFWGGGGGGGGRGEGGGVRRTRDAASGREDSPPSTAASSTFNGRSAADHGGGGGGGGGARGRAAVVGGDGSRRLEAVAQQLVEIFPSMGWGEALNAARLSNGSTTQAVEYALSNHSSSGDASPQGGQSQAPASRDGGGLAVGASGQGVEGNRAGRRWWE
ncbi:unnamed protein product, partial [Ectocarpus fasciculatus]